MTGNLLKRVLDLTGAALLLVALSPLMLVVVVMIRRESPGGALFRQTRVGRNGEHFQLLKFRSMVADAPRLGGHSTQADDPRITRIGQFIRKTSLDELPQLVNVLRGNMSLVGPRPCVPAQQSEYTAEQWRLRHLVRPGITGLAQISGRSDASHEQRTELDIAYARSHSLAGDLSILFQTAWQVAGRRSVN